MKRLVAKKDIKKIYNFIKNRKELFKFASGELDKEIGQSILNLVDTNYEYDIIELKSEIINENPDCVYKGQVYRKLLIPKSVIESIAEDDIVYKDSLLVVLTDSIETDKIQSSAKSLSACEKFMPPDNDNSKIPVIISYYVTDGLDIMKLAKKYKRILKRTYNKTNDDECAMIYDGLDLCISNYSSEEEILGTVSNEYGVISVNGEYFDEMDDDIFLDDLISR